MDDSVQVQNNPLAPCPLPLAPKKEAHNFLFNSIL